MALRLVDMENALVDKEKNDAWSAWLVMQLQKCMPDWRTKASLEEIEAANNAERIVIHNVDIVRMLKVKNLAQKWRMKSKKHSFERQARELEDEYKGDQLKLVQKLERLRIKSAEKIRQRILARKKSTEGKLATIAPVMERRNSVEGGDGGGGGGGGGLTHLGKAAAEAAKKEAKEEEKKKMSCLILEEGVKLTKLGFHLSGDYKGRVAVRSIEHKSKAYANGIRDGFILRYIGEHSAADEAMSVVVRLLRTQPRPLVLRFEYLDGGVSTIKEGHEDDEEEDPDMI